MCPRGFDVCVPTLTAAEVVFFSSRGRFNPKFNSTSPQPGVYPPTGAADQINTDTGHLEIIDKHCKNPTIMKSLL